MQKTKKLGGKLTAILLSLVMIFSSILPSMTVYAVENGIETGSDVATQLTDSVDGAPDETVSDNGASDDNTLSDEGSDEDISDDAVQSGNVFADENLDKSASDKSASDSDTTETETGEDLSGENSEETEAEAEELPEEASENEEVIENADEQMSTVSVTDFSSVGGWNESIYAEIAGVKDGDVTEVSYSGPMSGKLEGDDFKYLVRDIANGKNESTGEGVRIDIPGLKAGTYTLTVKVGSSTLTKGGIVVTAYDRSGYAHFNYTSGVGAYNDDGTLKNNAIVIYVTDDNKNTVKIPYNNDKTAGIGKIFSSSSNIVRTLAQNSIPLVVRFVGTVSETGLYERGEYDARYGDRLINGLSAFSTEYKEDKGEWDGDNGHMTYIHSFKDLTLEGIGYDATIDGWGFQAVAKSDYPKLGKSFEVRNLTFINTPEDAVGMEGQQDGSTITVGIERCWIHNISCYCPNIKNPAADDKTEGDGSVDFKKGQYLTSSYNFFEGSHKTHLVGGGDGHLQYNLTYHHNHWYMCNSRGPLARNANIHMYNNFVDMQRDYAQNVRASAYIFSEYNLFYASRGAQNVDTKTTGNAIKSYNDSFSSVIWNYPKGTVVTNKSDYVKNSCGYAAAEVEYDKFDTDSSLSYIPDNDYKLQTDFTELRKVIASQAGVMARKPKSITDVTESDYSVIGRSGVTVKEIDSLPKTLESVKTTSKGYAFKVNKPFDLKIEYSDSSKLGILVNAAGENLLEGNGSIKSLLPGTYMIQSVNFTKAEYSTEKGEGTPSAFNDITIKSLEITGGTDVAEYTLYFDANGGSEVDPVTIYSNQKYEIAQMSTRSGYEFAGWYDELSGGNRVSSIDGSTLTGDITLYAHWTKQGTPYTLSLNCDTDLDQFVVDENYSSSEGWNITATTESINGFIIHATSGSKKEGDTTTKYYMTIKEGTPKTLGTNGVLITDKNISGNEDGLLKSIEFTTKGPGTLIAEMSSSAPYESDKKYNIVLGRKSSDGSLEAVVNHSITNGKTKTTFKFEFDKAGTYYLYPTGDKGVLYYSLNVQGVKDEEVEQPKEYTVKFDAGEGTLSDGASASVTALAGANVSLPGCTPPTNKTFKGWSVGNSTEVITSTYTVNAADANESDEIILKAVYTNKGGGNDTVGPNGKNGIRIEGLEGPFYYTGAKIIPDITVKDYSIKDNDGNYGKILAPGVDYTVKYSNNIKATADPTNKAGKAKVTVTGKGNYTGKDTEETFEIVVADRLGDSSIELADLRGAKLDKIEPLTYTGDYQYPKFTLTIKNKAPKTYEYDGVSETYVTEVEDEETSTITYEPINVNWALSNNRNKGTATLLLTGAVGSNGKATTLKKTFKINAIDLSKVDVDVEPINSVPYSVKGAVVPAEKIVVKVEGFYEPLKNGIDYTVKFTANKKATQGAATANVVITGKGNFAKKPTNKITYVVDALDMGELKVSAVTAYEGMKAGKVKATVLDKSGNVLKASQYTVEVYKLNAEGKKVKCADSEVLKSGEENKIYVAAKAKDTKNLVTDSSTPLENAEAFEVGKNIAKAKFKINIDSETGKAAKMYTGDEITLDADDLIVTIKEDGKTKTLYMKGSHDGIDEGYQIAGYTNNIKKGTATVIIKGIGEYSGTKTVNFKIVAKKMDIWNRGD